MGFRAHLFITTRNIVASPKLKFGAYSRKNRTLPPKPSLEPVLEKKDNNMNDIIRRRTKEKGLLVVK